MTQGAQLMGISGLGLSVLGAGLKAVAGLWEVGGKGCPLPLPGHSVRTGVQVSPPLEEAVNRSGQREEMEIMP